MQEYTLDVVEALKKLLDIHLHNNFMKQIELGTGKQFVKGLKVDWFEETVQITNAFMHAKYMQNTCDMILKYGVIREDGNVLKLYGWSAVLCLYKIR